MKTLKKTERKKETLRKIQTKQLLHAVEVLLRTKFVRFIFFIRLHRVGWWLDRWVGGAEEEYTNKYLSLQLIGFIFEIKLPKMWGI